MDKGIYTWIIIILLIVIICKEQSEPRPDILIKSITTEQSFGRCIVLVDYFVDGLGTNATFMSYETNEYKEFMKYLKRIGVVRYSTPFLKELEDANIH